MMRQPTILAFVCALGAATVARAQPLPVTQPSFNPQLFHPAPGPDEFVTVESPLPLHHLQLGAGAYVDWARNPLSILTYSSRTQDPYGAKVLIQTNAFAADVWVGLGLWERLQIALALPLTLYETGATFDGDYPPPDGIHVRTPAQLALGDPRLYLKVKLFGRARGLQLGLSHWLSAPLGNDAAFGGEPHFKGFAGEPRLLGEWIGGRWRVGLSVGFQWRAQESVYYTVGAGQQLTYAAAGSVDLWRTRLRLIVELYGHHDFSANGDYTAESPLELDLSARVRLGGGVALTAGAGVGVLQGAGAPMPRLFAGASYVMPQHDRDHDGIVDARDRCPDQPEDVDGFEDQDGCPDLDDDSDGIPDAVDKCPREPEDFDHFQDEDGCPEPDNDGDGIDDAHDKCPLQPEDGKGAQPHDGCPLGQTDTDGDGIIDSRDKCPTEPEDVDGFQDEDGCPDPDNDNDGVPDNFDECPNDAEDAGDGGNDDDGCPDGGQKDVKIKDGQIQSDKPLGFDGDGLTGGAEAMLAEVAALLKSKPALHVRVEGYADSGSSDDAAQARSQADAALVRRFLVQHGVAAARLVAIGYGVSEESPGRHVELQLFDLK